MFREMFSMPSTLAFSIAAILLPSSLWAQAQTPAEKPVVHFHHVHLNTTDPQAAIEFYTTKFAAEKGRFAGLMDAVWAQKSWILFTKVNTPPPSDVVSTVWHIGWGAEDMKTTYQKQLDSGTKFQTPLTDISDLAGRPANSGTFFYAYVDGPDHVLIELNTAGHHNFGHLHLLSEDPVAAADWYAKHFGVNARKNPNQRMYRNVQVAPSASFTMDNVNVILYPVQYAKTAGWKEWENRTTLEPTRGRAVDHIGFSVDNLEETLKRLEKDGVKITVPMRTVRNTSLKIAFIEGPDKMSIELVEGHAKKE
jgi:catechol 2,3-dioxygenase-like lactoylglutathione lyase family enzyme